MPAIVSDSDHSNQADALNDLKHQPQNTSRSRLFEDIEDNSYFNSEPVAIENTFSDQCIQENYDMEAEKGANYKNIKEEKFFNQKYANESSNSSICAEDDELESCSVFGPKVSDASDFLAKIEVPRMRPTEYFDTTMKKKDANLLCFNELNSANSPIAVTDH